MWRRWRFYISHLFSTVKLAVLKSLLEKAMAPHSSTLAWKIPWTEEPGRLQSMGSLRVRHDWATSLSLFTFMHWRSKWQPTPVFLPGESQGWESLVGSVYGVAQSRTRLQRLSSSSSSKTLLNAQFTWRHLNSQLKVTTFNLSWVSQWYFNQFSLFLYLTFCFLENCPSEFKIFGGKMVVNMI